MVEETLSGKATRHCTNGIVIQRKTSRSRTYQSVPEQRNRQSKRRSVQVPVPIELEYNAGVRCGPPPEVIAPNLKQPLAEPQNVLVLN